MPIARSRGRTIAAAGVLAGLMLAAGLVLVAGAAGDDHADRLAAGRATYPSSMDALGGSVTRGFNTDCPDAWVDCPGNSWATGANPAVDSVYLRLLALNPRLRDHNANDAASGSTMADLDEQAQSAVRRNAELVMIAMGTNDACGGHTGAMTEVSVFRDEFAKAMDTLTAGLPRAWVHVVSIPDLYRRWETFHTIPSAVKAWRSIPFCPTLLTHPTSSAPSDAGRRAAVRARVLDFNSVLAQVCAKYPRCTTDGGAAFRARVTAADFSTHDYWHPNIAGQAALAGLVWETLRGPRPTSWQLTGGGTTTRSADQSEVAPLTDRADELVRLLA
jgi:lysophospholipase L1-like esterase